MTDIAAPPRLDELVGADGVSMFAKAICAELGTEIQASSKLKLPKMVEEKVSQRLTAAMRVDVLSFLAAGWNAALELNDCRRRSLLSPTSIIVATLGRHTIEHDFKPTLIIGFGVSKSFSVDAAVAVQGTFDGVELSFEGGHLVSLGSGRCDLGVALKVAGQMIGAPFPLKSWRIPGQFPLARTPPQPQSLKA